MQGYAAYALPVRVQSRKCMLSGMQCTELQRIDAAHDANRLMKSINPMTREACYAP